MRDPASRAPRNSCTNLKRTAPLATLLTELERTALDHLGKDASPRKRSAAAPPKESLAPVRLPGRRPHTTAGLPWHTCQDVRSLLDAWVTQQRSAGSAVGWKPFRHSRSSRPDTPLPPVSDPRTLNKARRLNRAKSSGGLPSLLEQEARQERAAMLDPFSKPPVKSQASYIETAASFEALLRMYYRSASGDEIEAMLTCAAPAMEEARRKAWVENMRANCSAQIKQAFLMGDSDGDGKMDLDEFSAAVAVHRGERDSDQPPQFQAIFQAADRDGDGQLDFDEFIELVSKQREMRSTFDQILALGSRNRLRLEEHRQALLFRHAISPSSHSIISPSGRRRRPTFCDLRSVHEVKLPVLQGQNPRLGPWGSLRGLSVGA